MSMPKQGGFTLLELLVVLAIVAIGSAGVGFAMRDGTQTQLEREALRLSALLETARARSQLAGVAVRWQPSGTGFRFDGLSVPKDSTASLPTAWLDADTRAVVDAPANANGGLPTALLLGPDPIIAPQSVTLSSRSQPDKTLRLATDGVRPFAVTVQP
ncbi:MAG: proteinral secretion pathway protein H [Comamonadaceae bacterium]|nr:MAG: proteinral secretion pathway protein H [Comamonadaceae bacterium]